MDEVASVTLKKVRLYFESQAKYVKSPYIYPLYGLGELPQAFARLQACYGGNVILDAPIDKVLMEGGKFSGVTSGDRAFKAQSIIADPSYFPSLVKKTGQIVRVIYILDRAILRVNAECAHIIIPHKKIGRNSSELLLPCFWSY